MNESRISVRYSRAVFQSAIDSKQLDQVNKDMLLVLEVCKIPEFREFLASPIILPSKKIIIMHSAFGTNVCDLTLSLMELVVRNGRERYLPAIARVFIHETMDYKGITKCSLTSAVHVDPGITRQVVDLISGLFKTKVELEENVDTGIIGGFILRVSDNYIDASVRNKLRKIRKGLSSDITNRIM
jgi:F-type H+-transporting ATPase subunit delta